jgi:hypothetical protein
MTENIEAESVKADEKVADESVPTSERKVNANRENAKQSTGPKTPQGKAYSRGNALKHGLTAKRVLFNADGAPVNEDLHELWDRLRAEYPDSDVVTMLLLDTIVVECWRQGKGLDVEMAAFRTPGAAPSMTVYIPNLQRYRTASQRALAKTLELLTKRSPSASKNAEDEADVSTPEHENPPQTPTLAKPTLRVSNEHSSQSGSGVDDEVARDKAA